MKQLLTLHDGVPYLIETSPLNGLKAMLKKYSLWGNECVPVCQVSLEGPSYACLVFPTF